MEVCQLFQLQESFLWCCLYRWHTIWLYVLDMKIGVHILSYALNIHYQDTKHLMWISSIHLLHCRSDVKPLMLDLHIPRFPNQMKNLSHYLPMQLKPFCSWTPFCLWIHFSWRVLDNPALCDLAFHEGTMIIPFRQHSKASSRDLWSFEFVFCQRYSACKHGPFWKATCGITLEGASVIVCWLHVFVLYYVI